MHATYIIYKQHIEYNAKYINTSENAHIMHTTYSETTYKIFRKIIHTYA